MVRALFGLYRRSPYWMRNILGRLVIPLGIVMRPIGGVKIGESRMCLDFSDNAAFKYFADRDRYEAVAVDAFRAAILWNPGSCAIDLGANYGVFTLAAAELSRRAACRGVIAVEPDRRPHRALRRSLERNGLAHWGCLHQAVISDEDGRERLWVNRRSSADNRTHLRHRDSVEVRETYEVEAVTVDHLVAMDGMEDANGYVIKMDIQGNELRAFRGMPGVLGKQRWVILFEYAPSLMRAAGLEPEELVAEVVHWEPDAAYEVEAARLVPLDGSEGLAEAMRRADRPDRRLGGYVTNLLLVRGMRFEAPQAAG